MCHTLWLESLRQIGRMLVARLLLILIVSATPAAAAPGWKAIDGDSIVSPTGEEIRVANVDTAEMDGRCESERALARQAKAATQAALDRAGSVTLKPYERPHDRYGRTLAYVILDGRDLGELLVAQGVARWWTGRRTTWCPA
jgi:micrococcal nuclease